MTGEELVRMWGEESNAANDCICEILQDYIQFIRIVRLHALTVKNNTLIESCEHRLSEWTPILETAKSTKEKANAQNKATK